MIPDGTQALTLRHDQGGLGFAWNNRPAHRVTAVGEELFVPLPDAPSVYGDVALCQREYARAVALNRGHTWTAALFVGSRRIVAWVDADVVATGLPLNSTADWPAGFVAVDVRAVLHCLLARNEVRVWLERVASRRGE